MARPKIPKPQDDPTHGRSGDLKKPPGKRKQSDLDFGLGPVLEPKKLKRAKVDSLEFDSEQLDYDRDYEFHQPWHKPKLPVPSGEAWKNQGFKHLDSDVRLVKKDQPLDIRSTIKALSESDRGAFYEELLKTSTAISLELLEKIATAQLESYIKSRVGPLSAMKISELITDLRRGRIDTLLGLLTDIKKGKIDEIRGIIKEIKEVITNHDVYIEAKKIAIGSKDGILDYGNNIRRGGTKAQRMFDSVFNNLLIERAGDRQALYDRLRSNDMMAAWYDQLFSYDILPDNADPKAKQTYDHINSLKQFDETAADFWKTAPIRELTYDFRDVSVITKAGLEYDYRVFATYRKDGSLSIIFAGASDEIGAEMMAGAKNVNPVPFKYGKNSDMVQLSKRALDGKINSSVAFLYDQIRDDLIEMIEELKAKTTTPFTKITFVGHSLGGAMANVAVADVGIQEITDGFDRHLVGFAGAPAGDSFFNKTLPAGLKIDLVSHPSDIVFGGGTGGVRPSNKAWDIGGKGHGFSMGGDRHRAFELSEDISYAMSSQKIDTFVTLDNGLEVIQEVEVPSQKIRYSTSKFYYSNRFIHTMGKFRDLMGEGISKPRKLALMANITVRDKIEFGKAMVHRLGYDYRRKRMFKNDVLRKRVFDAFPELQELNKMDELLNHTYDSIRLAYLNDEGTLKLLSNFDELDKHIIIGLREKSPFLFEEFISELTVNEQEAIRNTTLGDEYVLSLDRLTKKEISAREAMAIKQARVTRQNEIARAAMFGDVIEATDVDFDLVEGKVRARTSFAGRGRQFFENLQYAYSQSKIGNRVAYIVGSTGRLDRKLRGPAVMLDILENANQFDVVPDSEKVRFKGIGRPKIFDLWKKNYIPFDPDEIVPRPKNKFGPPKDMVGDILSKMNQKAISGKTIKTGIPEVKTKGIAASIASGAQDLTKKMSSAVKNLAGNSSYYKKLKSMMSAMKLKYLAIADSALGQAMKKGLKTLGKGVGNALIVVDVVLSGVEMKEDIQNIQDQRLYLDWNGERVYKAYDSELFDYVKGMKLLFINLQESFPLSMTSDDFVNTYFNRITEAADGTMLMDGKDINLYDPRKDPFVDASDFYDTKVTTGNEWSIEGKVAFNVGKFALTAALSTNPWTMPLALGIGVMDDIIDAQDLSFKKEAGERALQSLAKQIHENISIENFLKSKGSANNSWIKNLIRAVLRSGDVKGTNQKEYMDDLMAMIHDLSPEELTEIFGSEVTSTLKGSDSDKNKQLAIATWMGNTYGDILSKKHEQSTITNALAFDPTGVLNLVFGIATMQDVGGEIKHDVGKSIEVGQLQQLQNIEEEIKRSNIENRSEMLNSVLALFPNLRVSYTFLDKAREKNNANIFRQFYYDTVLKDWDKSNTNYHKLTAEINRLGVPDVNDAAFIKWLISSNEALGNEIIFSGLSLTMDGNDVKDSVFLGLYYHEKYSSELNGTVKTSLGPDGKIALTTTGVGDRVIDVTSIIYLKEYIDSMGIGYQTKLYIEDGKTFIQIFQSTKGEITNIMELEINEENPDPDINRLYTFIYLREQYKNDPKIRVELGLDGEYKVLYNPAEDWRHETKERPWVDITDRVNLIQTLSVDSRYTDLKFEFNDQGELITYRTVDGAKIGQPLSFHELSNLIQYNPETNSYAAGEELEQGEKSTTVVHPNGDRETTITSFFGLRTRKRTIVKKDGSSISIDYDLFGDMVGKYEKNADGSSKYTTFTSTLAAISSKDRTTSTTFFDRTGKPTKVELFDQNGKSIKLDEFNMNDIKSTVKDVNGNTVTVIFSLEGKPISSTTVDPNGKTISSSLFKADGTQIVNSSGKENTTTQTEYNDRGEFVSTTTRDHFNRVIFTMEVLPDGTTRQISFDIEGSQKTEFYSASGTLLKSQTLDKFGAVKSTTTIDPDGNFRFVEFGEKGVITTTIYSPDGKPMRVTHTDATGAEVANSVFAADGTSSSTFKDKDGNMVSNKYNADGSIISSTTNDKEGKLVSNTVFGANTIVVTEYTNEGSTATTFDLKGEYISGFFTNLAGETTPIETSVNFSGDRPAQSIPTNLALGGQTGQDIANSVIDENKQKETLDGFTPTGKMLNTNKNKNGSFTIKMEDGVNRTYMGAANPLSVTHYGFWIGEIPNASEAPLHTLDSFFLAYHIEKELPEIELEKKMVLPRMSLRIKEAIKRGAISSNINSEEFRISLMVLKHIEQYGNIQSLMFEVGQLNYGLGAAIREQMDPPIPVNMMGEIPQNKKLDPHFEIEENPTRPLKRAAEVAAELGDNMMARKFMKIEYESSIYQKVASEYLSNAKKTQDPSGKFLPNSFDRLVLEQSVAADDKNDDIARQFSRILYMPISKVVNNVLSA